MKQNSKNSLSYSGYFKIANFVIFQLIWVAAVLYQNAGLWACVVLLAVHFALSPQRKQDITRTYKAILIGISLDFVLMQAGIYEFQGNAFPLWLVCLWVGFILALRHSMSWLSGQPVYLQMALGAVGGTLSYLSSERLGAVEFTPTLTITVLILMLKWGMALPVFIRLVNKEKSYEKLADA